jgi:hypothetical protein
MPEYQDYEGRAEQIELEIERKLVILGLDWRDENAMRVIARDALSFNGVVQNQSSKSQQSIVRVELYGLIGLMLRTMEESAGIGREVHGRDAWKAVARALWTEKGASGG